MSSGAISVAGSFRGRAGSLSPPTTRKSSCDCSRTSRTTRRSSTRFAPAETFTVRRRQSSSACRSIRSRPRCGHGRRRSTSRRSTARARTRCRGSSNRVRGSAGVHRSATSSASRAFARYLDSMVAFAREHGYVQTIFGRRRYIPELRDRNFNIRAFGERTAANSPIQGSAADLIKIAMIRIDSALACRERADEDAAPGAR